jgi:hypothetical protein
MGRDSNVNFPKPKKEFEPLGRDVPYGMLISVVKRKVQRCDAAVSVKASGAVVLNNVKLESLTGNIDIYGRLYFITFLCRQNFSF